MADKLTRLVITHTKQTFVLSAEAYDKLVSAGQANQANLVFDEYAPHIPACSRCAVWLACE